MGLALAIIVSVESGINPFWAMAGNSAQTLVPDRSARMQAGVNLSSRLPMESLKELYATTRLEVDTDFALASAIKI